jgi:hypothetical protein
VRRFLWIWLTLLGAWWVARTLVITLLFQRIERGPGSLVALVTIPALQAAVVWWVTRER